MSSFITILLVGVVVFFAFSLFNKFKFPKVGSIAVFTGGVKVGKSGVSLACALSNFRRAKRRWRFRCIVRKFFNQFRRKSRKKPMFEEPYFYSSIPLGDIPHIPLTREHLLRKKRIRDGSVVFIDEASLVCDSQLIKDKEINKDLLLFFKLFGHECGGLCVVNTHCISDLHYSLKRCTSQYFYVHHLSRWIPFFCLCYMREERYSEDNTTLNTYQEDIEDTMKRCIMRKSIFKKYDFRCFSYLTDSLPYDKEEDLIYLTKLDSLKAEKVVSFRPEFFNLKSRSEFENGSK